MNPFDQKFIENPQFLQWVFKTNPLVETYWENYLIENPEENDQLIELKERLIELRFSNDTLDNEEKDELKTLITKRLSQELKGNKRRLILNTFMKYAAVALIFTVIGGMLVYYNTKKDNRFETFTHQSIPGSLATNGPLLITSNGKNVELKKTHSTIDYTRKGAVVLNNDSVLSTSEDDSHIMNQLVIPYGNQSHVVLSDNTVVYLNAGSRLVYPTQFTGKTREVLLFGEAYFDVAKNPDKPFIVKTSNLDIKVLGTKFNVSSYAEDNLIQTVLKEGSVSVRRNGAGFFEKDIIMKPNQMTSFDKTTSQTKIQEVDSNYYTLWTKGLLSFEEIDFARVIKKLERFYNISITFSDPQKQIIRISGKLDLKRSRKEVIEYLEKVSMSRFELENENQYTIR